MTTNNTGLLIKLAIIMTRSKKLSLTFKHQNSINIGYNVLVAYLKLDKKVQSKVVKKNPSINLF